MTDAVRRLEQLNPDQFELYFERVTSTKIDAKDQLVDAITRAEDVGLAVRLLKDRRLGFSYTTSLEPEAIRAAVETAFEIAQVMPEDAYAGLQSFGSSVYPEVDTADARGPALPLARKIELAKSLEAACRSADRRVTGVRRATLGERLSEIHLVDSSGEHLQHRSTLYSASITCKAEQDGDSQTGSDFGFSNFLDGLDVAVVGRRAASFACEGLGATQPPTLNCPAVLRNSVVAELIEFLSPSFSAEQIDKGRSMLAGKSGTLVFAEGVTLVDDGLLPGGYATAPFDAEGVPSRRTVLIDGGFVSGALYDGYYARKFGVEPTASAVRGIKSPPSIRFSNLSMRKGRVPASELVAGISSGVLITDLMGMHTANPVTGDFSLGASGILIEGGKLTRPVKGFAVAGNVLELFRKMTDIGDDLRFFGNVGAPSVRVSEIAVGGA